MSDSGDSVATDSLAAPCVGVVTHSPCTWEPSGEETDMGWPDRQLTEADLARLSDALAWVPWVVASRDARPMLWHVRRRTLERVAARMGLPAAGVQGLLWVASERGDACGSLPALAQADPAGLCLPPKLREPYRVWAALSELSRHLVFYTLSEEAVCAIMGMFVR